MAATPHATESLDAYTVSCLEPFVRALRPLLERHLPLGS